MKKLLISLLVLITISCSHNRDKTLTYQENKGPVKIICPKSIQKDNEFIAKMYSIDPEREIVNSVVDGRDFSKIDSVSFKIQGCFNQRLIVHDTVYLAFLPTHLGDFVFENISIITTDLLGRNFEIHDVDLRYNVTN